MKINIDSAILKYGLSMVAKSVSSTDIIPILKNVLLEAKEEGYVEVSSTDTFVSTTTILEANFDTPGKMLLPFIELSTTMNRLEGPVSISDVSGKINIKSNDITMVFNEQPIEDYPVITQPDGIWSEQIEDFGNTISKLLPIINKKHPQQWAHGVLFGKGYITATDSIRMGVIEQNVDFENIVIPAASLESLKKADVVKILKNENMAFIQASDTTVNVRLLDTNYPPVQTKYNELYKGGNFTSILFDRKELLSTLTMCNAFNDYVKISLKDGFARFTTSNEKGEIEAKFPVDRDIDLDSRFNAKFVIDGLNGIEDERIMIGVSQPGKPMLITGEDNNNFVYILAPLNS